MPKTPFEGFHLQVIHKYSVPLSERCQTPFEGFHLQVIHKYSVPLSQRCQTPFQGFHLQVIHKLSLLLRDAKLLMRDSIYLLYIETV